MELLRLRGGIDAKFVDEQTATALVHPQGGRGVAGVGFDAHEGSPRVFANRVQGQGLLQHRTGLGMLTDAASARAQQHQAGVVLLGDPPPHDVQPRAVDPGHDRPRQHRTGPPGQHPGLLVIPNSRALAGCCEPGLRLFQVDDHVRQLHVVPTGLTTNDAPVEADFHQMSTDTAHQATHPHAPVVWYVGLPEGVGKHVNRDRTRSFQNHHCSHQSHLAASEVPVHHDAVPTPERDGPGQGHVKLFHALPPARCPGA